MWCKMKTSIHWVASDVKLVYSLIGSKIRWQVRQGDSTKTSTWGWRSVGYFSWSFFCAAHCGNRMWLLDIRIGANPNRCAMRIICTRCLEDLLWKKRNAKYLNFYINHMLRWQYLQYIKLKYLANLLVLIFIIWLVENLKLPMWFMWTKPFWNDYKKMKERWGHCFWFQHWNSYLFFISLHFNFHSW